MDHYRDNLRHIVRPEDPAERESAVSITLDDHEALFLADGLTEYAAYKEREGLRADIARGYVEYIDMVVRDEQNARVTLYAHTAPARSVLRHAATCLPTMGLPLDNKLVERMEDLQHADR